uniref:(northern house mosquito) hypothetical protein n=1 Tax=Culex pipiens TaxID=7175 RepID=A0A8D8CBB3_CULPI
MAVVKLANEFAFLVTGQNIVQQIARNRRGQQIVLLRLKLGILAGSGTCARFFDHLALRPLHKLVAQCVLMTGPLSHGKYVIQSTIVDLLQIIIAVTVASQNDINFRVKLPGRQ